MNINKINYYIVQCLINYLFPHTLPNPIPYISRHLSLSYLLSSQDPTAIGECKHSLHSFRGIIPS